MKRVLQILGAVVCFATLVGAQSSLSDAYLKVQKKLFADKKYLNVFYVSYQPSAEDVKSLTNIPKSEKTGSVSFRSKENVTYQIYFLRENFEMDSVTLLTVKQIEDKAASSESFFGQTTTANTIDTITILSFGDLQDLYFADNPAYSFLFQKVAEIQKRDEAGSILGISLSEHASRSKGITSPDNIDFLNYMRTNGIHRYPVIQAEAQKKTSSRRKAVSAESSATEFQVDASFSHLSFFHKSMELGFGSISAELGVGARDLNQVPWKTMALNVGVRSLIIISNGPSQNIRRDLILDAKIMGRIRVNTYNLSGNLPFVFGEKPSLNVGSGLIVDVAGTRTFGLPFFNLYLATGSNNVEKPYASFGPADSSTAYFTFKQWEASWSFYWNSNEDRLVRYRMDIGAGNYDVYKAVYAKTPGATTKELVYNKIKPLLAFNINFAPQNIEFMGIGTRFYDNVLALNLWLKLLEFDDQHTIRLETTYYTAPMFRSPYPWEAQGGNSIVQVRYRYGVH